VAEGHGGYRKPTNPAVVSGPGAHSQRTDGKQPSMALPNAQYGEAKGFQEIQSGAPLAQSSGMTAPSGGSAMPSFTPMDAPSTMPDTPVTDGAQFGAGAGPEALGLPQDLEQMDAQHLAKYLPTLISIAERDDTPPGMKAWVRSIIARS
jgi:hypothetical protein